MTDTQTDTTETTTPPITLSSKQFQQIKRTMCTQLNTAFQNFHAFLRNIPVQEGNEMEEEYLQAFKYFDLGFLAIQKAIILMPIEALKLQFVSPQPEAVAQPTETVEAPQAPEVVACETETLTETSDDAA